MEVDEVNKKDPNLSATISGISTLLKSMESNLSKEINNKSNSQIDIINSQQNKLFEMT